MLIRWFFIIVVWSTSSYAQEDKSKNMLHVSFDITRELFKDINANFIKKYDSKLKIRQSHGGSGKQTSAVIHGLPADIVSLALPYHMDLLAQDGFVNLNWRELFPNKSSPFITNIVFLVRKDNPKKIKDWDDLVRPDIKIIVANPKTSGGALWNYVAAWIYASRTFSNDLEKIEDYMYKLYSNAPVLDSTARAAAVTFIKRYIGDVLITWESEAEYIVNNLDDSYEIIAPSFSIKIDVPIAVIVKTSQNKQEISKQYIDFIFSEEGQEIAKKYYYRGFKEYKTTSNNLVDVDDYIDWKTFKKQHFNVNGVFDKIYH